MLQCRIKTQTPAAFLTCGNLISEDGFVHARRTMNCFVLLLVQEGTLYLTQEEVSWEICPGEFFLLFPGKEHFGTRPSQGPLSYYWVHFALEQEDFQIFSAKEPLALFRMPSCFRKRAGFPGRSAARCSLSSCWISPGVTSTGRRFPVPMP